jgi:hypothetical protein
MIGPRDMLDMRDMRDLRDTRFTITISYSPQKEKLVQDMLNEAAAARRMDLSNATCHAEQVFTLDEALNYFQSLKAIQEKFDRTPPEADAVR